MGEAVVFQWAVVFFPAVTVAFRVGCLACSEDFSVVLLNYGLQVVCAAVTYFYVVFVEDLELDSVSFEVRLPLDKIDKCLSLIASFLTRKKVTLKEIQSLTGMLNFACSVVVPGRAFLRRLIDLTVGVHSPYHYVRISREVKADLKLWQSFLTGFNGRSFFLEDFWDSSEKLELFTDAAGSLGLACNVV